MSRPSLASPGNGKAVLEAVGLDTAAIGKCYVDNPRSEEEAVQTGLRKWTDGHEATWKELIGAMEQARIAVQTIRKLKKDLKEELQCEHLCTCVL